MTDVDEVGDNDKFILFLPTKNQIGTTSTAESTTTDFPKNQPMPTRSEEGRRRITFNATIPHHHHLPVQNLVPKKSRRKSRKR
jgi:hypothetical protein